jgi:hypothetical protein
MGFKLTVVVVVVVVVSVYRHCPAFGLLQTRLLYSALQDYEKPMSMALNKQTSARCQTDPR